MKKLTTTILILLVLLSFTTNSFAQAASLARDSASTYASLKDVKHYIDADGQEKVVISLDVCNGYNVFRLSNPDRIVIDIANTYFPGQQQVMNVNGKSVKAVRYARFNDTTVRVVLDMNGTPGYDVEGKENQIIINILGSTGEMVRTSPTGSSGSASRDTGSDIADRGNYDRKKLNLKGDLDIEYSSKGSADEVVISIGNSKDYNIMRLTGPDRIVVDIPGLSVSNKEGKIDVNSSLIKSIRYANFTKDIARVVLDVKGQTQFKVNEGKGRIILDIESPKYKNIAYHNNGDRVYLSLAGAKLTEGGEVLKKFYTEEYSSDGKKYTITFPSNLADIGEGEMIINDGFLNSIQIIKNPSAATTSIVFNAKGKFVYRTITRSDVKDTAITILKPASKSEKLVVIDPGHGGVDPGAVYGSLLEKDLNLDIALRLNNLLKNKKIKTYMIREDDSFVGLYERAYIANDLNASLFLSIHNNSVGAAEVNGTMTLYYPPRSNSGSFNGKTFAQIVQSKLVGNLKTTDRKIIERPNLVVLKATAMPAALAEVGFITNAGDRAKLQTAEFRQKVAQALCDAIIEALKYVK